MPQWCDVMSILKVGSSLVAFDFGMSRGDNLTSESFIIPLSKFDTNIKGAAHPG